MDFDLAMDEMLEVDVSILAINYRDDVSEQRKGEIENIIRHHFPSNA